MVEMSEVAEIVNNATKKSLVILDEIGRGTSTFDGLSMAWAIVEYCAEKIHSRTLFATHYHELTKLEGAVPGVKNYCIAAKKRGNAADWAIGSNKQSSNSHSTMAKNASNQGSYGLSRSSCCRR